MPKTRNVYKEGTKIKSKCRVCLTQSNNVMFKLKDKLTGENYDSKTYLEALEKVTSTKIELNDHYPECICPMCVSFLKMTLKFIIQFENSHMTLRNIFKNKFPEYESINLDNEKNLESCDDNDGDDEDDGEYITEEINYDPNDPSNVQLIIKDDRNNLNEVIVLKNEDNKNSSFNDFFKNLKNKSDSEETITDEEKENGKRIFNDSDSEFEESIKVIIEPAQDSSDYRLDNIQHDPNIEIEEQPNDSDSQRSTDNLEFEFNIHDKETIDSLIIDNSKEFDDKSDASSNKRENKEDKNEGTFEEAVFPCGICKKVFSNNYSLRSHIKRLHTDESKKTFTCEICGTLCRSRSAFVNHKLKHFDKKFKCELCDKAYNTKAHLKVHMITHSNKRPFLCNVCGKDFNYANALSYHMRLHTGEKNYHCEYCSKRFTMVNSLIRHIRTHTGEKPYQCQYCGRYFSSKGEVVCHEYIHTGYRPYHCKYCKKGFSKTHNLKIHLLSHGGPYNCQFCSKTFIEEKILSMHHKISHKDLLSEEDRQEYTDEDSQGYHYQEDSKDGFLKVEMVEDDLEIDLDDCIEMKLDDV